MNKENKYLDCKQMTEEYPFSMAMIRRLALMRKHNGLNRAVIKLDRKILFNRERFEKWLETFSELPDSHAKDSSNSNAVGKKGAS